MIRGLMVQGVLAEPAAFTGICADREDSDSPPTDRLVGPDVGRIVCYRQLSFEVLQLGMTLFPCDLGYVASACAPAHRVFDIRRPSELILR